MKKQLETLTVKSIIPLLRSLPLPVARSTGASVGWLLCEVLGIRHDVMRSNIKRVFPDLPDEDIKDLVCRNYQFFSRAAVDWLRYEDVLKSETLSVTGWENIREIKENGGIIVTGHIGYWELAASQLASRLEDFTVYADRQSNPETDKIIRNLRESRGVYSVNGPNGLRKLVRRVKDGRVVGVIGDQRPRNQHEYVKFFGEEVKNTRILSFVARKTQRPVVPIALVRTGETDVELRVYPALEASKNEVTDENRCELLREYNQWLEERIKEFPRQYFWPHKRWEDCREAS